MTAFVDTSSLYALLNRADAFHGPAAACWRDLITRDVPLVTHNYVLVETIALVHRRLGLPAVRVLRDDLLPVIRMAWIEESLHRAGMTALLAAERADVSLVDWISFEFMRTRGLQQVFAFDDHFGEQGFTVVPDRAT